MRNDIARATCLAIAAGDSPLKMMKSSNGCTPVRRLHHFQRAVARSDGQAGRSRDVVAHSPPNNLAAPLEKMSLENNRRDGQLAWGVTGVDGRRRLDEQHLCAVGRERLVLDTFRAVSYTHLT